MSLSCPSCNCGEVATTWIDHRFPYGVKDPVMLKCKVPLRSCLNCSEEWLDHVGEDIMAKVVTAHLRTTVIDDAWEAAGREALERAKAFNIPHVLPLMAIDMVAIEDMDEWCKQTREDYPCHFKNHVVEGLG